jgi:hypothetical protein
MPPKISGVTLTTGPTNRPLAGIAMAGEGGIDRVRVEGNYETAFAITKSGNVEITDSEVEGPRIALSNAGKAKVRRMRASRRWMRRPGMAAEKPEDSS